MRMSTRNTPISTTHISTGSVYVRKEVVTDSITMDDRSLREVEDKYEE
jgi:hypothetical protein